MKIISFWCLFLLNIGISSAQSNSFNNVETTQSESSIGLSVGLLQGYFKDSNYSPLNYTDSGSVLSLYYSLKRPQKSIFNVRFNYGSTQLETDFADYFTADFIQANLQIGYLKQVKTATKIDWYLGGQFRSTVDLVDYDEFDSFTYFFGHGLRVKGLLEYELGRKHQLTISASIPVLQYIIRPPYNGYDKVTVANESKPFRLVTEEGLLTSLHRYQNIDLSIDYNFQLSDHFSLTATYLFQYHHINNIHQFTHLTNQVALGLQYKF